MSLQYLGFPETFVLNKLLIILRKDHHVTCVLMNEQSNLNIEMGLG